jgi:hypothetical protein
MTAPRPVPDHLPPELLQLVGKIAIQSTYVDLLIGEIVAGLQAAETATSSGNRAATRRREIETVLKQHHPKSSEERSAARHAFLAVVSSVAP